MARLAIRDEAKAELFHQKKGGQEGVLNQGGGPDPLAKNALGSPPLIIYYYIYCGQFSCFWQFSTKSGLIYVPPCGTSSSHRVERKAGFFTWLRRSQN